ncbi:MAG TPA: phosphate ABC transporter permease subunit PstC [Candidatus Eubacterium faecipullorum]|uniref:Phosphate ABC transporter permease subunit PstC n=1 Tax=Candidatus Eubacterium faecipullorum TaxID=2838571 RepID=A0A9D1RH40_9FIRM|nr:phosphate ABC transporter permease subunit PstC [Candidatus Eubacterium faecipullorum]
MVKNRFKEFAMRAVFFIAACVSILAVGLICWFIFSNAFPAIGKIGVKEFLLGTEWRPLNDQYGILPMIVGSLYVTALAIAFGVPLGVLCAVFLAEYCPKKLYAIMKPAVDLLAGIPSVVYGFFALVVIVPAVRNLFGGGKSVLAAAILLAIMILPTVISVSESALRAVPQSYKEGALALGATKERAVFGVSLPAARSGISAGIILGIGRAVGETTAVVMIAGNQPVIPQSVLQGVRTLTTNIILEMGYAQDLHREALIATAAVLFVFVLLINLLFSALKNREDKI